MGGESLSGPLPHTVAIHSLGLFNRLHEDSQSPHIFVRFHALPSRRQTFHDDSRSAISDEGCTGSHAHSRTAGQ